MSRHVRNCGGILRLGRESKVFFFLIVYVKKERKDLERRKCGNEGLCITSHSK